MRKSIKSSTSTTSITEGRRLFSARGTFGTFDTYDTLQKAFTLIELLIVMAVLGVLASVVIVNIGPASQQRARDTIRRNDIKQYQTALEVYANKNNGNYPSGASMPCGTLNLLGNLCKKDPKTGLDYAYSSDGTIYVTGATLEYKSGGTQKYFISCSNGLSGDTATAPGAVCPL